MKIGTKLTVAMLLVGLIPALTIAFIAWQSTNTIAEGVGVRFQGLAIDIIDKVERNLFERYGDVQAFGFNSVVQEQSNWYAHGDDNPIVHAMNNYVDTYDIYYLALLVDPRGKVIAVNSRDDAGNAIKTEHLYSKNFAGASWLTDALAGRFLASQDGALTGTVVEDLHIDADVQQIYGDEGLTLGFSAPVRNASGKVIAVWKNFAKWTLVEDIFTSSHETLKQEGLASAELTLLNKNGRVIVDCDPVTNGKAINRDMNNVILKLNLGEKGVLVAKEAVAGKTGHASAMHARKEIYQTSGYAHSQGALGYPGLGWSALVRVAEAETLAAVNTVRLELLVILAVICAVVPLFAIFFAGFLVRPIKAIVTRIRDIAEGEGDLTQRVDDKRRDEIGELGSWFNTFVDKIDQIIGEVSGAMSEVASASTEIAASSEEMAKGMTEQNREITQISSAVEEMSASVIEVARKSGEAANNASDAGRAAETGGEVVEKTIDGMEAISAAVSASAASVTELGKRGEQIGQIIDVINDIADQTNLLALNAAIEAARAGEHGRGFAVVADEVRKLADRTTKATAEVAESINAIQAETSGAVERMHAGTEEVKIGVGRATEAGESLRKIVTSSKDVAGMIQSIAAAAEQQSAASEEVSRSITSIGSIVKVAEQGAKQSAEAVVSLAERSNYLQNMIGQFKTSAITKAENAKWTRPAGEQTRILVVDDDPAIVNLLQGHLKDYGQCTTASNGGSAISAFRGLLDQSKCFDLVCLDIKMPDKDGIEVLNQIRNMEKSYGVGFRQRSRVVMVTALDTPQDKLKAFKDACDGYLTKPFDKSQVEKAVEQVGIRKQS